jgi:hypothetical protein
MIEHCNEKLKDGPKPLFGHISILQKMSWQGYMTIRFKQAEIIFSMKRI